MRAANAAARMSEASEHKAGSENAASNPAPSTATPAKKAPAETPTLVAVLSHENISAWRSSGASEPLIW